MKFFPIKTRPFIPPRDNIFKLLDESLPQLKEGDVVFITSKILSIHQGKCVKITKSKTQKSRLTTQEADYSLPASQVAGSEIILTIKDYTLIPSSGIDESNGSGYLILWPKHPSREAKTIGQYLKRKYRIKKLSIIITDSHTTPLRWGTQGISIGFYGLEPLLDYRGKKDIFGRKLKHTQVNVVDSLTAMAVLLMGEGDERQPLLVLRGANFIRFTNKDTHRKLVIEPKKDLYYPLLKIFRKNH
ncbi:MAG: coenzyme F420-0:L-glutamate ligase [Patescibacteria group bacterium]|nr:coenzyme F420-0:L-glutamate ligase [Patescibacteria group bacterium]